MGAGDVKLCAAIGAWIGPNQLFIALVVTGLAGGLMGSGLGGLWRILRSFSSAQEMFELRKRERIEATPGAQDALCARHRNWNPAFIFFFTPESAHAQKSPMDYANNLPNFAPEKRGPLQEEKEQYEQWILLHSYSAQRIPIREERALSIALIGPDEDRRTGGQGLPIAKVREVREFSAYPASSEEVPRVLELNTM